EPYITCDMQLMLNSTEALLNGIQTVKKHLGLAHAVIGIEDNKPQVIQKLTEACKPLEGVTVKSLKAVYPKGAEKVLTYECTGRVIQEGKLPADAGVIVCNVATLAKLSHYLKTGIPLTEKVITVDGSAVTEPKNVIALIGTQMADIIAFCGGYKAEPKKLLMGGPMMGTTVPSDDFPLLKNNNAILAFAEADAELAPETACIRCGRCLRACPFDLAPAKLDKAYRAGNVPALRALKVNLCMECGCCAYVCPARRDLVMSNKLAKQLLRGQKN
ncbi:MAG: RnfABCDGE type electron transport complex subunit C, partial [Angelakisella sp.]